MPQKPLNGAHRQVAFTSEASGPRAKGAFTSLGRHLKLDVDDELAGLGAEIGDRASIFEDATGNTEVGAYYAWAYADFVTADFLYRCGDGEPVRGHVLTWSSEGTGFLPCADRQEEDADRDGTAARAAALELCPEGSPAAKVPETA